MSSLVDRLENAKEVFEETNHRALYRIVDDAVDRIESLESQLAEAQAEIERLREEQENAAGDKK